MIDTHRTDDLARGNHNVPTWWAEQLERELSELRKDKERLDWMEENPMSELLFGTPYKPWREAIDISMEGTT